LQTSCTYLKLLISFFMKLKIYEAHFTYKYIQLLMRSQFRLHTVNTDFTIKQLS